MNVVCILDGSASHLPATNDQGAADGRQAGREEVAMVDGGVDLLARPAMFRKPTACDRSAPAVSM
jgi:hypothetical protein